jgi:hypothetical protein
LACSAVAIYGISVDLEVDAAHLVYSVVNASLLVGNLHGDSPLNSTGIRRSGQCDATGNDRCGDPVFGSDTENYS